MVACRAERTSILEFEVGSSLILPELFSWSDVVGLGDPIGDRFANVIGGEQAHRVKGAAAAHAEGSADARVINSAG